MPSPSETAVAEELCAFVDDSPSPYHATETAARLLGAAGFTEVDEADPFPPSGRHYVVRGGSLVAWATPERIDGPVRFRLVGAHTDSPNLRVKPNPDVVSAGLRQLGVEIYGGVLLNSWLDRDLGLSGRVTVATDDGPRVRLVCIDEPLLRVPQLAIHLDREINDKGLQLDRQRHLSPMWALAGDGAEDEATFVGTLAEHLDVAPEQVLAWEVMAHDLQPSRITGLHREFVSAPRIDNLLSCFAGATAMARRAAAGDIATDHVAVLALFDHEEVGSTSDRGAAGAFSASVLERISLAAGWDRATHLAAIAGSVCVSADGAHATNPNYADRHEPSHTVTLDGGPVLKVNANVRYATDAASAGVFVEACRQAGVPMQRFVTRTDLPCGSTIGPLTASALAMPTVDVGAPQLAMHSARELTSVVAVDQLTRALTAYLS
ncbi:MAG: M18 family aminopeptidase [Actinomycetota bacterium]|nr:M18 family aminopeptidase [Actinomycetota bacterium]